MDKRTFTKADKTVSTTLPTEAVSLLCSGWTETSAKPATRQRRKSTSQSRRKAKATGGTTKAESGTAIVGEPGPEIQVESEQSDSSDN